ncbi:flavin-containing monooxygenase [Streptomyces geranii]|uniref:flavin-containing monooxygenase n=1 Tax=Streptomyces geranii TaxID=2058923 RepID=UPI000D0249F3|nr:NAD(P)/FAD-dependent oxidoreductase [Streptomyces geranii]
MMIELPVSGVEVKIDFDPEAVMARYGEERESRLQRKGFGDFERLDDQRDVSSGDPFMPVVEREPVTEEVEVLILGGGFGGLLTGARLKEHNVTDSIRIIEQGGDFGGTWYWNRYPGLRCDVESYIYLPLLEETGYIPTQKYSEGHEILEHAQRIARHYGLYEHALFHTAASSLTWVEDESLWECRTDRGDVVRARYVMRANGPLQKSRIPRIPGISKFQGEVFHSSRWNFEYTGGSNQGGMTGLNDKRVAIVGTGPTAIQAIPYLAEDAAELFVVQRTPCAVDARGNAPTDMEWAASLRPGWQAERHLSFNSRMAQQPVGEDLVDDGFSRSFTYTMGQHLVDVPIGELGMEDTVRLRQLADLWRGQQIRNKIEEIVEDPRTAEMLKPWYGSGCKRPSFSDTYYQTFNRPNVHLLYSPDSIDEIRENAIVVGGEAYEVDCIIFATGFDTGTFDAGVYGYEVRGREGRTLSDTFKDGLKSLHGFYTHGFPNFFELGLSQNGYIANFTFMLDQKAVHVARLLAHTKQNARNHIEPTEDAQSAWVKTIRDLNKPRTAYFMNCTPGFFNGYGNVSRAFFANTYAPGEVAFWEVMNKWWEDGNCEGLILRSV